VATITSTTTNGQLLKGMMSIGVRPTIDGKNRTIEINIFDFEEDIYGKILKVFIHKYLRDEIKFNTLDELKAQMLKDKSDSLNYFAAMKK
jgi:riboflavin kinase/FMN adenylyltransferase